jgi:hypothetical protein
MLTANYRNVYDWIKKYRKYDGLDDGIGNKKRKNGGRKPVISSDRNKQMIKERYCIKQVTPRHLAISKIPGVSDF